MTGGGTRVSSWTAGWTENLIGSKAYPFERSCDRTDHVAVSGGRLTRGAVL